MNRETDILVAINYLNNALDTVIDIKKRDLTLFLDSFDEGAYIKDQRDHLIENIWSLIGEHSKIIVACRTNYITSTQDLMWFSKNKHEMRVMYLAPFNYQNK